MKRNAVIMMGASIVLLAASQLQAQSQRQCAPRDAVVARLAETYGESRQAIGLGGNNAVMEVFASEESGSWTITVTMVNGMTCLLASGQAFETLAEALPALGNDA